MMRGSRTLALPFVFRAVREKNRARPDRFLISQDRTS